MLFLPALVITLSSISGASGLAFSVKSIVDSMDASATNRYVQDRNNENILKFQATSNKLNETLEDLGKQRMMITNNFSAFVNTFERIHNRPEFTSKETPTLPTFNFNEIKNVSILAETFLGVAVGAIGGSALAAAATSGTTAAVMALGTASTGTKIIELSGAAATKAALAALGGGSLAVGGGGIALGTLVLNIASLGVGALIEGIAMAYAGSVAKKHADKAKDAMINNERIINDAIAMQNEIMKAAINMRRVAKKLNNDIYKPLVFRMRDLVDRKNDWNSFSASEKVLVENNILIVQLLNYLNNIPLYEVKKYNNTEKGIDVEEVVSNADEVKLALNKAKQEVNRMEES